MTAADPKVVLVTGASGGVGRGIAIACGLSGWTVWIAARREAQAAEVAAEVDAAGGTGRSVACDVADPASVREAVAAAAATDGRLDGVVHNQIVVPEVTRHWARVALDRMLTIQ